MSVCFVLSFQHLEIHQPYSSNSRIENFSSLFIRDVCTCCNNFLDYHRLQKQISQLLLI